MHKVFGHYHQIEEISAKICECVQAEEGRMADATRLDTMMEFMESHHTTKVNQYNNNSAGMNFVMHADVKA